jgi:hypothetical protein
MKTLTAPAVAQFRRDGFYFPIRVLSPDEVAGYRARLETVERAHGGPLGGELRHKSHLLFTWLNVLIRHPRIVDAVENFRTDILPVTEKAASIAEHLEQAALSVKDSVEGVTDTIDTANEALRDAVATADARFREFDAIVRVARDEAEDAVVGAASVIRGVRSGASAFRHRRAAQRDDDDIESDAPAPSQRRRGGPRTRHQRSGDAE